MLAKPSSIEPPPENWRRPTGRPRTTWMKNNHEEQSSLNLGIHEATDLAQNRPLWRLMSLLNATRCTLLLDLNGIILFE